MSATPPKADCAGPEPSSNGTAWPAQDRTGFETLYQRYSREVWALAYARWMNADTAMDITQEAFLRLWKKWEDGEAILNPRAWLLRVSLLRFQTASAAKPGETAPRVKGEDSLPSRGTST